MAATKYDDPSVLALASSVEQKLKLPAGVLASIVTRGERSNSDQVSEAGARGLGQIIPATRKAAIDKYGIDPYLSDENSLEVAGNLLKDSLDRNKGDVPAAVGEYHGGIDRKNWGARTNAYVNRVMTGLAQTQKSSLSNDFADYMKANPAVAPAAAPQSATPSPLAADFSAWRDQQAAAPKPTPEPTGLDKIIGAGEAALSTVTGATTGYAGALGGLIAGGAQTLMNPAGGDQTQAYSDAGANALTYAPKTASGQEQAAAVGDLVNNVAVPIAGLAPELAILHSGIAPAGAAVRGAIAPAAETLQRAATAAPDTIRSLPGRVAQAVGLGGEKDAAPTPGTMGSAGAAGTDMATQRQTLAQDLPVPIKLTAGQASRDYAQQRFEQETAKDPTNGAPLRNRYAEQNEAIPKNFEAMIDSTGAEKVSPSDVGRAVVDEGLVKDAAARKAEYRVKYKEAEKAGEMAEPVSLQSVVDHLNQSAPEATTAPLLNTARQLAIKLGIAQDDGTGNLVAKPIQSASAEAPAGGSLMGRPAPVTNIDPGVTLGTAEQFRQAINRNTDYEPTNVRQATILKQLIDQATEGKGGELYQQARKARQRYAQLYENNAIVSDLLNNRRGTADRTVSLENVFRRTVLNGSREDLGNLRRTLHVSGSEAGKQAWRELQGATLRHINEESTKGVGTDVRGNPIVSPAKLNNVVRSLDQSGKLDFVLGKKGAQNVRDINDLSKVVFTSPAGAINHSNTASVILAALAEAGVSGSMTGLPIPVLSGLRVLAMHVKDKRIQQRVSQALGEAKVAAKIKKPTVPAGRSVH